MERNFVLSAITPCSINELRSIKADIIINGEKYMAAGDRGSMLHTFKWDEERKAYHPVNSFKAHGGAVSALTYLNPGKWMPNGALFTASQDKTICSWDNSIFTEMQVNPVPTLTLIGHENNVCFLSTEGDNIISSSWDGTARVWSNGVEITKMSQDGGIWCVVPVPCGYATLGADKSIRIYSHKGAPISALTDAHADVVRSGLYLTETATLVTTSNDGTIREWFIEEDGRLSNIAMITVTDTYLYTIAIVDNAYVVGGEDRCAYIVDIDSKQVTDVIPVPGVAWCVSPAPNGVAITATDGVIYTFSRDMANRAKKDVEDNYINRVAGLTFNNPQIDQYYINDLPHYSDVNSREIVPGRFELMRDGEEKILVVYNQTYGWMKVGTQSKSKGAQAQKYTGPDGKEYDYCFTIEVEDLHGSYPLYMNYNTNPFIAAGDFIRQHNLPTYYLDQIANFIIRNLRPNNLQMQQTQSRPEPEPQQPAHKSDFFPIPDPNYIVAVKTEPVVAKLQTIAAENGHDLTEDDMKTLNGPLSEAWMAVATNILLLWPVNDAWPILDIFRAYILGKNCRDFITDDIVITVVDRFASSGADLSDFGILGLMRVISNLQENFASSAVSKMKILDIFDAFVDRLPNLPRLAQIPFANAMMNYTMYGIPRSEDQKRFVAVLQKALTYGHTIDEETLYRLLMAAGNTAEKYPGTRTDILSHPELLDAEGRSERVQTLINEVVKVLE